MANFLIHSNINNFVIHIKKFIQDPRYFNIQIFDYLCSSLHFKLGHTRQKRQKKSYTFSLQYLKVKRRSVIVDSQQVKKIMIKEIIYIYLYILCFQYVHLVFSSSLKYFELDEKENTEMKRNK